MTEINLLEFCSKDQMRKGLQKPFKVFDNEVCATNGHVAVIVKGEAEASKFTDKMPDLIEPTLRLCSNSKIPEYDLDSVECDKCGGDGILHTCPSCDGEEQVTYHHTFFVNGTWNGEYYHIPCEYCNETGKVEKRKSDQESNEECTECSGAGTILKDRLVKIGKQYFDKRKIEQLKKLSGIRISTNNENVLAAARITFDEGYGLIMPMRKFEDD